MTIFYPDISSYQAGLSLNGALAVSCKATEGTSYFNSTYGLFKAAATALGIFFFGYHFLRAGNAAAQANYCFSKVGSTPVRTHVRSSTSTASWAVTYGSPTFRDGIGRVPLVLQV